MSIVNHYQCQDCKMQFHFQPIEAINTHRASHGKGELRTPRALTPTEISKRKKNKEIQERVLLNRVVKTKSKKKARKVIESLLDTKKALEKELYEMRQKMARQVAWSGFYSLPEWRALRYAAIEKYGKLCMACGVSCQGKRLHVDHIIPRKVRPDLMLDITNLQILCDDCNVGKSDKFQTDWRVK